MILGAKVPAAAHGLKVSTRVAGGGAVAAGVLVAAGMDAGGGEGTVMVGAGAVAGAMVAFAVMVAGPVPAAGARAVVHPEARSVTARAVTPAAASVTRLATAGRLRRRARSSSSFTVSPSSGSSVIVDAEDPPAVAMAQPRPPVSAIREALESLQVSAISGHGGHGIPGGDQPVGAVSAFENDQSPG